MAEPRWILQRDAVYVLRFPNSGYMLPAGEVRIIQFASDMMYMPEITDSFGRIVARGPKVAHFDVAEFEAKKLYQRYMKRPLIERV